MLKSKGTHFTILHRLADLAIINLSWWIFYYVRFESKLLDADSGLFGWYFKFSILITLITYYNFRKEGLYNSKRLTPIWEELFSVFKANFFSVIVFIVLSYFLAQHKVSRFFLLSHFIFSTSLLMTFKVSIRRVLKKLRKGGKNLRHILLVGNNEQINKYAEKLLKHPEYGVTFSKWIKSFEEVKTYSYRDIEQLAPDSIVFGLENEHYHLINPLLIELNNSLANVIILPDLSHSFVGYKIVDISGTTGIMINEPGMRTRSILLKRTFDIASSFIGLLLISPLLASIALLIKLTSKGPILYSQIRMGLDGKEFKMWKFRSMSSDSSNSETWTIKDDPRVTSIGKFIRKTSLDELPQLLNVLVGDMSLVGPRPERPMYVEQFKKNIPTYMLRHKMKAGMTGWAQVNGWRGDTSIEKRIECDLYYIRNWSIWMDLWIISMTFWKGFVNKNAY